MNSTKKETIWFVSQYAGAPEIGMQYRQYQFAKELQAMGHDVAIISSTFSHLFREQPPNTEKFNFEFRDSVQYCWVKTPRYQKSISLGRFWNMLMFAWKLFFLPTEQLPKPTLVIISSPSMLPIQVALKWRKKFRCKIFFEVRDIWPLTLMELGGLSRFHPLVSFMRHFEKKAYRKSDKVISLLPCAESHFLAGGMQHGKFIYIPNGIDSKVNALKHIPNEHSKKIIIGYGGSLGKANALDFLLDAAEKLTHRNEIEFVLMGKGDDADHLKNRAEKMPNVLVLPPVEKRDFLDKLASFDICYLGLRADSLFRFGVSPNKLFDYMQAAKPIIYNIDSGNKPVDEAKCGISVTPGNTNELIAAIEKLASLTPAERIEMGERGKAFVMEHHTYHTLAKKIIESVQN
jgi:glycosyltransferase involved in cell wall biosynthesis